MKKTQTDIINQLIEDMGMIAQGDGMPRIAGKIMGLLVVEVGPYSFSEIAQRLQVSRGSISTNTRLLENLHVIERVSKKGERGDYFQLAEDPYSKLLQGVSQRMEKSISILQKTRDALPKDLQQSQARIQDLQEFYIEYLKSTTALIGKLQGE
ncbi:transcriptional regulator [uncultured Paraglaciecola sp.]|uniref:GbsR/MarR family transcriptional regulator n=1 Tax=uncultured Paraglaciecola sp. TaxID=1765024 RepID=UPI0026360770|nr:transcriptional regulator [uncultured Paraglaciecola sp.]